MQNNTVRATLKLNWSILIAIIFVVLKLCHIIEWSWLWVLSPMWISLIIDVVIIIVVTIIGIKKIKKKG